ncbi:hypothetical protein JCM11491_004758 [Sporobolomyces phaffii]
MKRSQSPPDSLDSRGERADEDDDDLDCLPRVAPAPAPAPHPQPLRQRPTPNKAKLAHALQTPSASPRHPAGRSALAPVASTSSLPRAPLPPTTTNTTAKRRRPREHVGEPPEGTTSSTKKKERLDPRAKGKQRAHPERDPEAPVSVKLEHDDVPDFEDGTEEYHAALYDDWVSRRHIPDPHHADHDDEEPRRPRRPRHSSSDDRIVQWQRQQPARRTPWSPPPLSNPAPNLEAFIHSLDLPRLQRLVQTFHDLGIEAAEDVVALASTTTVGIRRRDAIWSLVAEVEANHDREFTEFERKTIELHLEEASQNWTQAPR